VPVPRIAKDADGRPLPRAPRAALAGDPPSPLNPPAGCRFHPRCPAATALCATERPPLRDFGDGRSVACHHPLLPLG